MGRFPNIAASKAKTGAQKAKIYSSYAKEIYQVAKNGGFDPSGNLNLRRLIEKAKKEQVPSDVINRAIEKAKGAGGEDYQTILYEGFGPGASTLIIKTMTDNVNRTVGEVRAAFNKVHKSLGVTNSVSYNYDNLTLVSFKCENEEEILNHLLEQEINIIDFEMEEGILTISVNPNEQHKLKDALEKGNVEEIKKKTEELQEVSMRLATKVYEEAAKNNQGSEQTEGESEKKDDSVEEATYEEK